MAGNQKRMPQCVGVFAHTSSGGASANTLALSAAATWLALGLNPDTGKSLTEVRVRVSSVTGTLGANDLTCDLYSDSNGKPNASVAGPINTVSPAAAANTWISFTFSSFALTAGTQYWIVLKNVNGTPASNFVTYAFAPVQEVAPWVNGSSGLWGWQKYSTTNSGTTWGTSQAPVAGYRVGYSDSTYDGLAVEKPIQGGSSLGAYAAREVGATFVTPAGATLNVRGIAFLVLKNGSPTGNLRFRLYNGTTLLATTSVIPPGNVGSNAWSAAYFSANQAIAPGTTLRVSMGVDAGGDTSNFFSICGVNIEGVSAAEQLDPFGTVANPTNEVKQTYLNVTWTDTATTVPYFALLLDSEGEFN